RARANARGAAGLLPDAHAPDRARVGDERARHARARERRSDEPHDADRETWSTRERTCTGAQRAPVDLVLAAAIPVDGTACTVFGAARIRIDPARQRTRAR